GLLLQLSRCSGGRRRVDAVATQFVNAAGRLRADAPGDEQRARLAKAVCLCEPRPLFPFRRPAVTSDLLRGYSLSSFSGFGLPSFGFSSFGFSSLGFSGLGRGSKPFSRSPVSRASG